MVWLYPKLALMTTMLAVFVMAPLAGKMHLIAMRLLHMKLRTGFALLPSALDMGLRVCSCSQKAKSHNRGEESDNSSFGCIVHGSRGSSPILRSLLDLLCGRDCHSRVTKREVMK